jgi:hypothetical protein
VGYAGNAIRFDFADRRAAQQAYETLEELGYEPRLQEVGERTTVYVKVERNDITSALEIAQCFGGSYVDESRFREVDAYSEAYQMEAAEEIDIPAHLVNEDLTEDYMQGDAFSADVRI